MTSRRPSAVPARAAALALAASVASLASPAAAQDFPVEDAFFLLQGCADLEGGVVELTTCYEPGDICHWSQASMMASVPGTFTVDLAWDITGVKEFSEAYVRVESGLGPGIVYTKGAAFFGTDAWCEPQPCGGFEPDISFEVQPGDVVHFELTNHNEPCFGGDGIRCRFENLRFVPAPGIADLGYSLDAAHLHDVPSSGTGAVAIPYAMDMLPDVTGDGVADYVVGLPRDSASAEDRGRAQLRSGADGAVVHEVVGAPGGLLGWSVAGVGDVDGDGVHDYGFAAPDHPGTFGGPGRVDIWSGADGSHLLGLVGQAPSSGFGTSLDGVGDVDGDGLDEFVVGSPNEGSSSGVVRVFKGNGLVVYRRDGTANLDQLGEVVAGVGDVDADGVPDFAASEPGFDAGGVNGAGRVLVWSGATGDLLWTVEGTENSQHLARVIAGVGDFDGDGHDDVAFGDSSADPGDSPFNVGLVEVFSGANGRRIFRRLGTEASDFLGRAVSAAGDVDGDGFDDLAVGSPRSFGAPGRVLVYGGPDGHVILDAQVSHRTNLGRTVAGGHDLDGDGRPDLVVGALDPVRAGRFLALSTDPELQTEPRLDAAGTLQPGSPLRFNVSGGVPNTVSALVTGLVAQEQTMFGGVLVPRLDIVRVGHVTDNAGRLQIDTSWATGPAAQQPLVVQFWMPSPEAAGGFEATNAVALTP